MVNYAERYRNGKRVSTAPAEANVNRLVAKRFVKQQQMRWSRTGAHYLLKVRSSVLNGDLSERTKYEAPKQPIPANIASFISPTPPLFRAAQPRSFERSPLRESLRSNVTMTSAFRNDYTTTT